MRKILQANIARLGQYSGADRLWAIADHARWHYSGGRMDKARAYAKAACDGLATSLISDAGKLEILAMNIGLQILEMKSAQEAGRDVPESRLLALLQEIDKLQKVASRMFLQPMRVAFGVLKGRLLVLSAQTGSHNVAGPDPLSLSVTVFEDVQELASEIGFLPARVCAETWLANLARR